MVCELSKVWSFVLICTLSYILIVSTINRRNSMHGDYLDIISYASS